MRYSETELRELIIDSAREANILPLTSACDSACIFCSHRNNPPEIRVASIPNRPLEDIESTYKYLDPGQVITIGDSATCIIEGEPTVHPQFREILSSVRRHFPKTPITVTTHGRRLTEDMVIFLRDTGNILINLSLNSASPENRRKLMGDSPESSAVAIDSPRLLKKHGVPFQGSTVAMPNITGWEDLEKTITHLAVNGARSVYVFMPGFSSFADRSIFPEGYGLHGRLREFIGPISDRLPCPVLLEPSFVKDLRAELSCAAMGSPAYEAGLRRGDVITGINGVFPRSRVEAFGMLSRPGVFSIAFERAGEKLSCRLSVPEGVNPGISMEYDFDMSRAEYIRDAVLSAPGHVLALTSEFGFGVFSAAMERLGVPAERLSIKAVKNLTFSGDIMAAGLLCISDYMAAYEEFTAEHEKPAALMVPGESFNSKGRDLKGVPFSAFKAAAGIPIAAV